MIDVQRLLSTRLCAVASAIGLTGLLLSGCANPDRVFFVTQTSLGVGADVTTGTAHVGYDRAEAFVGPDYPAHGGLPPVAASLQSDLAFLAPNVKQFYATGDAALIASGRIPKVNQDDRQRADLTAAEKCSLNLGCAWTSDDDRRLSVIATNTHVGFVVKAKDGNLTSVDFGYGRQEASMLPLRKTAGSDIYPSALAAISIITDSGVSTDGKVDLHNDAGLKASQFIATGAAADALAGTSDVKTAFKLITKGVSQDQEESLLGSLGKSKTDFASEVNDGVVIAGNYKKSVGIAVAKVLNRDLQKTDPLTDADRKAIADDVKTLPDPVSKYTVPTDLATVDALVNWIAQRNDLGDALINQQSKT